MPGRENARNVPRIQNGIEMESRIKNRSRLVETLVESRSEMFKLRNVPGPTAAVGWGQKAFQWHIFNY